MTISQALLLFFASLLGGAINSVAGGGSFFAFPALIFTGVTPIVANATSTLALWTGSLAITGAYRRELQALNRTLSLVLTVSSLIGGVIGALLLLHTPQATFSHLVPYLLLFSTLIFAFSGPLTTKLRLRDQSTSRPISLHRLLAIAGIQCLLAIYGGYFGGGMGFMMLAALALLGIESVYRVIALKSLLAIYLNGIAILTFLLAGAITWPQGLVMIGGAIIGGYCGAYYAQKLNPRWVRLFVICVGFSMALYFFLS